MRPVIQSYKKVLNEGPVSAPADINVFNISEGEDSVAAGQTGPADVSVPTGSVMKYFELQHAVGNTGTTNDVAFVHVSIQHLHKDQSIVDPAAVGGNKKRNQVMFQQLFQIGLDESNNRTYKYKIPKSFQRVREGDTWIFVFRTDSVLTSAIQCIYKFYR